MSHINEDAELKRLSEKLAHKKQEFADAVKAKSSFLQQKLLYAELRELQQKVNQYTVKIFLRESYEKLQKNP